MKKPIDTICEYYRSHQLLSEQKIECMRYAMLSVFYEVIKLIMYYVIYHILGKSSYFLFLLCVLFPIRWPSGGVHAYSFWGCFFISFFFITLLIYVSPLLPVPTPIAWLILVILSLFSMRHIPYTPSFRPITNPTTIRRLRYCYLILIFIWVGVFNIAEIAWPYVSIGYYTILLQVSQLFIPTRRR